MSAYLEDLNEVQRKAVTQTDGPVLVVAGPGSGKTRVLTFRIAHLIEKGVAPWEILALTFTNKAAREMKDRIAKVVGDRANRVWAGTFHSIFARILRVEAEKIGYPSDFTIYDSDDSKSVINAIIKEMNLNKEDYNTNAVRARISSAKSNVITPKAYAQDQELLKQDRLAKRPHMSKIYSKYVARCKRAGAMDFDDLLFQLLALLVKNPDNVLDKYQQKFRYLLVDEFQDTNYLQYIIIKKLANYENSPRNICVVGDDAQSIYAFRGATIENILDFEKEYKPFGIQVFKLEQNYRSTDHIVQAANELISKNNRQIPKTIWSDKGEGQKIKLIKGISDAEEGRRVADTILEHKNRFHLANQEIAVLYRTNAQSRIFEEYLRRANIPYKVFGGQSFYQRKEVKDLLGYLRITVNLMDEEALRRIINFPRRGIGASTIEKLSAQADAAGLSMWNCLDTVDASARAKKSIIAFHSMISIFHKRAESADAHQLATYIFKQSGMLEMMKKDTTVEGIGRLENVNALLDGIKDFVENDEQLDETVEQNKSLASYLQNIALLTDFDQESNSTDYITLMSVHAAKGLEFKSVFVVGMEEKLFPSGMAMESREGLDEERRLFYVAITRAEQFLTLTYANSRYRYGQMRYNKPSRFLEEIPVKHLESTHSLKRAMSESGNTGSKVIGNFSRKRSRAAAPPAIDPATFKPSPSTDIQAGMKVAHMRFGEGKVLNIDGASDNRVATIFFKGVDNPQRRIMLRFAKLQILD